MRTAYDQGCRVFLEVGCDNKRTGAIQQILDESSGALMLSMDGKVGDPKTQHARVWAQLISNGFELERSPKGCPRQTTPDSVLYDIDEVPSTASLLHAHNAH